MVVVVGFLRTQQHWEVVFWVALLVWVVVWGLFGCGCACEGGFFNMAVNGLGEFAMLESCGRIFMLWELLQEMVLAPVSTVEKLKIRAQIVLRFQKEIGMVRSPRFEPGSSAWQADVLDQTRLRPLSMCFSGTTTSGDVKVAMRSLLPVLLG